VPKAQGRECIKEENNVKHDIGKRLKPVQDSTMFLDGKTGLPLQPTCHEELEARRQAEMNELVARAQAQKNWSPIQEADNITHVTDLTQSSGRHQRARIVLRISAYRFVPEAINEIRQNLRPSSSDMSYPSR